MKVVDEAHITRLLEEEGGVIVEGPNDTETPPLSPAEAQARTEAAQERVTAVAMKITDDEKKTRPTRKR